MTPEYRPEPSDPPFAETDLSLTTSAHAPLAPWQEGLQHVRAVLGESNETEAFERLDELCEWVMAHRAEAEFLAGEPFVEELRERVAALDSWNEKRVAREVVELPIVADVVRFPWYFDDYYSSEVDFLSRTLPEDPERILQIGQGAVSQLAGKLFERYPDAQVVLCDFDAEATALSKAVLHRIYPLFEPTFLCEDAKAAGLESTRFGLLAVSNAPLEAFLEGGADFQFDYLFVRSATPAGALLYPRIDQARMGEKGLELVAAEEDGEFGIHEWTVWRRVET